MSINTNNAALNEILETINELPSSKEEQEKSIDITENGETVVVPDDENTTLSKVTVNVDVPTKEEQEKAIDITENGTTVVTPDEGMTLSEVTVNVAIESGGGTEEFTGFKLSGFVGYNQPTIADARSVPTGLSQYHYTDYWFANTNANPNGGYWTRLEDVYLPSGLSALGNSTFIYCGNLKNIYGDLTSIKSIAGGAFSGCKSLQSLPYMPNLEKLHAGAFTNCVGLTCVKIYKTLTQFNETAFKGCTNILDIYVPWAEGTNVSGDAPWGATNATIHYNTTYDENHNPIVSEV